MMPLNKLQAFVATVDKQRESPVADEILQPWPHDLSGRPKYWRASANFVFFYGSAGQSCVLRFNHADYICQTSPGMYTSQSDR